MDQNFKPNALDAFYDVHMSAACEQRTQFDTKQVTINKRWMRIGSVTLRTSALAQSQVSFDQHIPKRNEYSTKQISPLNLY